MKHQGDLQLPLFLLCAWGQTFCFIRISADLSVGFFLAY